MNDVYLAPTELAGNKQRRRIGYINHEKETI